jgi:hypothetical protein
VGWLDVVLNMALSMITKKGKQSDSPQKEGLRCMLFRAYRTTHQRGLPCSLDTVQPEEEWRGIRAFFLVIVMMCFDFVENERYTVLGFIINYLDGHCSVSVQVSF